MKYESSEFVDYMTDEEKTLITKALTALGLSDEDIERGMGGRICDLEDTVDVESLLDCAELNERIFISEGGCVYLLSEIEEMYAELKASFETESETFADYLTNCTDGNGTLTEIK